MYFFFLFLYSIKSSRLKELDVLAVQLFNTLLPGTFYTPSSGPKSAGGAFQIYYSKQREKEIDIGRLQSRQHKKLYQYLKVNILQIV